MKKDDFYRFLRKIPKAEIHLHVEGTINRNTVKEFLLRSPLEEIRNTDVDRLYSFNNLKEFINSFLFVQGLLEKAEDLKNVIEDVAVYLKENHIVYCECFFSPTMFLKKGFIFDEMLQVLQSAINTVESRDRIVIKLLIDVSRTFGLENAQTNLKSILSKKYPSVLGIGLGGDEQKGPAKLFGSVFQEAKRSGLHVVSHAGEDDGPQSVWDALDILASERIGHGISAIQDEGLIRRLVKDQIPVEVCITSNLFTKKFVAKAKDHPIRPFFDAGVVVTVNTDDPTFFDVSLLDEYWALHSKLKFTMNEVKTVIQNGFKASFLPAETKTSYLAAVDSAWAAALIRN